MADQDIERVVNHYDRTPATIRVLVTGSREWVDRDAIRDALLAVGAAHGADPAAILVVHGGARGADRIAASVAMELGMRVEAHSADWPQHGRSAGFRRNERMVMLGAHRCVAFALAWDSGTGHCARMARDADIPTVDYGVDTRAERHMTPSDAEQPVLFEVAS
jgi:hypothetical protein